MSDNQAFRIKKSPSLRKMKKPLIEKRHRERINKSLDQLRDLLLDNMKRKGVTQTSKLDKADILELTVSYVKLIKFEENEVAMATRRRYKAGYHTCAREALKCMNMSLNVNQTVKTGLEKFLTERCDTICSVEKDDQTLNNVCSVQNVTQPITVNIPATSFPIASRPTARALKHRHVYSRQTNMLTLEENTNLCVLDNDLRHHSASDSNLFSSGLLDDSFSHTMNYSPDAVAENSSKLFASEVLDNSVVDNSHALNLSSADSSFNCHVWRPW